MQRNRHPGGHHGQRLTWSRTRAVYEDVIDLQPNQRPAFLDQHCPDRTTRREVEDLAKLDGAATDHFSQLASRIGRAIVQRESRAATNLLGQDVAGYQLLEVLGRGGMGIVYLAQRTNVEVERPVALKLLPAWMAGPRSRQRFEAERDILSRLRHDSIASLVDGGVSPEGRPYIAMEYVDGLPIDFWCDAAALNIDERILLFQDVCSTVQFAHDNQVIHCDVKPSNVLVTHCWEEKPLGRVKLVDFGVARLLSNNTPDATACEQGMVPLTPAWASPEQLAGKRVTTATDVYAMTALLYRLLVGVPPYDFSGQSVDQMRQQVMLRGVVPPRRRLRGLRPERANGIAASRKCRTEALLNRLCGDLTSVLMKGMERRPELRYATPNALAADLRDAT